jgi:hypothetical protein
MVDIMMGVVIPVQNNQSRNSQHRSTLKKKNQKEMRKKNEDQRSIHRDGDWVTLSRRSDH